MDKATVFWTPVFRYSWNGLERWYSLRCKFDFSNLKWTRMVEMIRSISSNAFEIYMNGEYLNAPVMEYVCRGNVFASVVLDRVLCWGSCGWEIAICFLQLTQCCRCCWMTCERTRNGHKWLHMKWYALRNFTNICCCIGIRRSVVLSLENAIILHITLPWELYGICLKPPLSTDTVDLHI